MAANYAAELFDPEGKPTTFLLAFWRARDPLQPLQATVSLIDPGGYGNDQFRAIWKAAFPDRDPLPDAPVSTKAGIGTEEFWDVFT